MGLSISGLLMQTLFRNPLAGPYVLGLSSGASLGVAAVILEPHFTAMANHYNAIFLRNRIGFKPSFSFNGRFSRYRLRDTMAI
jgi:iron complex transport system permease protein